MMKKILSCLLTITMLISMFSIPLYAEETKPQEQTPSTDLTPHAQAAYLIEYTSGKVIYAKNENEKLYPASMTKMMGLLLIFEALHNGKLTWEESVITSEHAASMGGSQVFLEVNETMSVKDMVKSICIASANDAMVAMGEKVSGTHENFVAKMNEKAKELQMADTHFVNATGLHDPNHYTTAKDMATLAQALIKEGDDELLEITSTYDAYIREDSDNKFWLVNTNKLLKQYPGVDGLKTGFTQEAMSCISATAKKDHLRLIAVAMKEPSTKERNAEIKTMFDYGFSQYDQAILHPKGEVVETRYMDNAKPNNVELVTQEDLMYVFEKGSQPKEASREINITKELPYLPEEEIGTIKITMDDGFIIEGSLSVAQEIQPLDYFDIFIKAMQAFLI